ncbi:hypothetical protein HPP92_018389 [Vanilla planifolia]|uniref:protein-serine/threonine phosphatase n=1 Tax=Vanilla planifolia TaxID=51239 RepID=A0A835URH5_VANPL|nr:hypothetical protein HPP92_018389 [Vanilla planifolia]
MKMGNCCSWPLKAEIGTGAGVGTDALLWCRDAGEHAAGEFSMAMVQANSILEDASQIESGNHGTFVGVYDGHNGPEVSRYLRANLFQNLQVLVGEEGMSVEVLRKAILLTDDEFLSIVEKQWSVMPQLAAVGSCCLTGVISGGILYVANLGDSRAVLGRFDGDIREIVPIQLSTEHNACQESVRKELHLLHPDDPNIVVLKHKVWRVKGIIQISRSVGDAYLKKIEFNREPLIPKLRVSKSFDKPIVISEPSIVAHKIRPTDQFVIFASDGLWDHISNQEAVNIVQKYPHKGIARRLIKAAQKIAARKREVRYVDLKSVDRGIRRHFHDDMTVIVLFLDYSLASKGSYSAPVFSLKGGKE